MKFDCLNRHKQTNYSISLGDKGDIHKILKYWHAARKFILDGRWTRKPIRLSRVQPIYLSVSRPSEVYVDFIVSVNVNHEYV